MIIIVFNLNYYKSCFHLLYIQYINTYSILKEMNLIDFKFKIFVKIFKKYKFDIKTAAVSLAWKLQNNAFCMQL